MRRRTAFSIIELLITLSIIGILSAAVVPRWTKARCKAETDKKIGLIQSMKNKIDTCTLLTKQVPNICSTTGPTTDCTPSMGTIQPGPIDCFGAFESEYNALLASGEIGYLGGGDGNRGGGNEMVCDYDPDNPSPAKAAADCAGIYFLFANTESCIPGMCIFADSTARPARLTPLKTCQEVGMAKKK